MIYIINKLEIKKEMPLLMCLMISILLNKMIKIWIILSTNSMFCLLATSLGTFYVKLI